MAASHSDPVDPNEGYSDFPDRRPADPPDIYAFASSSEKAVKVPPATSFRNIAPLANSAGEIEMYGVGGVLASSHDQEPWRMPYSDSSDTRYKDDPEGSHHDGEFNSVFADGERPRNFSSKSLCYHRKAIGTCFLGVFFGMVIMFAFILITGDRSGVRLGSSGNGNVNGLDQIGQQPIDANPINPISDIDGKDGGQDTISVWVSGKESPVNGNEIASNEEDKSNKAETDPNNDISPNNEKDNGMEGDSGAVTAKVQLPISEQGEEQNDAAPESANDAAAKNESVAGGDDAQNDSNPTATKNESGAGGDDANAASDSTAANDESVEGSKDSENNPAKDVPTNPNTPQIPPNDTGTDKGFVDTIERDNPDVGDFCGSCTWKSSHFTCDQRVADLVRRFQLDEQTAKENLIKQGHCPSATGPKAPLIDPAIVPKIESCRERPIPGEDAFCFHCQWKNIEFTCLKRVEFLKARYNTPEKEAMAKLMEQGHCKDERTPEQLAEEKKQGIDMWCGACMFRSSTCDHRATGGGIIKDETVILEAKQHLLSDGVCSLPPYCDSLEDGGQ